MINNQINQPLEQGGYYKCTYIKISMYKVQAHLSCLSVCLSDNFSLVIFLSRTTELFDTIWKFMKRKFWMFSLWMFLVMENVLKLFEM